MGRARNVTKESTPVSISDGDIIHLRRRLGVGEATRMRTAGIMGASNVDAEEIKDRRLDMDMSKFKIARVLAWVSDWTLVDDKGVKIPLTVEGVESLDEETFDEIENAISARVKEIDAEKKARAGAQK